MVKCRVGAFTDTILLIGKGIGAFAFANKYTRASGPKPSTIDSHQPTTPYLTHVDDAAITEVT